MSHKDVRKHTQDYIHIIFYRQVPFKINAMYTKFIFMISKLNQISQ